MTHRHRSRPRNLTLHATLIPVVAQFGKISLFVRDDRFAIYPYFERMREIFPHPLMPLRVKRTTLDSIFSL